MKIAITTLISFLLFVGVANAQHVNIGVKGGLNAYTLTDGSVFDHDLNVGFNLGLIGHVHLADPIALQPELVYSMQGNKNTSLNYINIPLIFQYMYDNGFRLQAGPQLGFLVKAESEIANNQVDVKDQFESIDLALGVGMSYVNPATNFGMDLRYNHGLSNISKIDGTSVYNRGFQVGVFYLFNHN
ncbi:porin family protein [Geofilum rubicundum]|uniref:porin family protein n=1 Tax=Geofilum rubicundum TaxID=472113 RepID=UPI0007858B5E|nr:porin family protein [Geofilum rubicundum]